MASRLKIIDFQNVLINIININIQLAHQMDFLLVFAVEYKSVRRSAYAAFICYKAFYVFYKVALEIPFSRIDRHASVKKTKNLLKA